MPDFDPIMPGPVLFKKRKKPSFLCHNFFQNQQNIFESFPTCQKTGNEICHLATLAASHQRTFPTLRSQLGSFWATEHFGPALLAPVPHGPHDAIRAAEAEAEAEAGKERTCIPVGGRRNRSGRFSPRSSCDSRDRFRPCSTKNEGTRRAEAGESILSIADRKYTFVFCHD